MRAFGFLALLALIVIGIGYWRGWFDFTVDRAKLREDADRAMEKVRDVGQKVREGVKIKSGDESDN